ncbi:hypothetical protein [Spirosoma telluris]|uniref:hypothetical protein n=1 Tax=Spirosoma telluris TaxID=2183553 RepID=UPI0038CD450B
MYISNDYGVPDYLYINNLSERSGGPIFTNQLKNSIRHISNFSMGNDVADVNNDSRPDILTLDMLPEDNRRQKLLMAPDNYDKFDLSVQSGFHYQHMRNMLQLNEGAWGRELKAGARGRAPRLYSPKLGNWRVSPIPTGAGLPYWPTTTMTDGRTCTLPMATFATIRIWIS